MMKNTNKLSLAVLIGSRNFFPSYLVEDARNSIQAMFTEMAIEPVMLSPEQTPYGQVETYQDAKIAATMLKANRDKIAGIVVLLPNFGDEKAVADAIRMSGLTVPVLIQAEADDLDKMGLETRRDSFCGKISLCNNLRQYGITFSLTTQHVCKIESDVFRTDLDKFARVCRTYAALKGCRIGAIGTRPASFNTVRYSEKMLERLGISVEPIDLSEIFAKVDSLRDDDLRIIDKLELLKANADTRSIPQDKLLTMAKLFVVIGQWVSDNDIDATAIQCWTSLQETLGVNVCSIMSVMASSFIPSACEVDVMGAISMYALTIAADEPTSIADWNNNFGEQRDKCVLFHCGNFATKHLHEPFMSTADIIGTTVGNENTCGAINGRMKSGPLTYFRLSTDEFSATMKAYVGQGALVDDDLETVGCRAVAQVPHLEELLAYICQNGFEHHVAFNHSSCADVLYEVFSKYMQVDCHYHH
ncbi:L-fucose/L-arabinose isomerase family protein [Celerinatantimonas yamalensis]|uniref:L-fucose/L-arabinose isomerase family protein n=1 Tax=Celerinatantimonas yamalensis TaxID=559956 RepID=A0ABW9G4U1_9GAMM